MLNFYTNYIAIKSKYTSKQDNDYFSKIQHKHNYMYINMMLYNRIIKF